MTEEVHPHHSSTADITNIMHESGSSSLNTGSNSDNFENNVPAEENLASVGIEPLQMKLCPDMPTKFSVKQRLILIVPL